MRKDFEHFTTKFNRYKTNDTKAKSYWIDWFSVYHQHRYQLPQYNKRNHSENVIMQDLSFFKGPLTWITCTDSKLLNRLHYAISRRQSMLKKIKIKNCVTHLKIFPTRESFSVYETCRFFQDVPTHASSWWRSGLLKEKRMRKKKCNPQSILACQG